MPEIDHAEALSQAERAIDNLTANPCCREQSRAYLDLTARYAALETVVTNAPHASNCQFVIYSERCDEWLKAQMQDRKDCNCWKALLDAPAAPPQPVASQPMSCVLCGSPADYRSTEGVWRHSGHPSEDKYFAQSFCDKYGYPIDVEPAVCKESLLTEPVVKESLTTQATDSNDDNPTVKESLTVHDASITPPQPSAVEVAAREWSEVHKQWCDIDQPDYAEKFENLRWMSKVTTEKLLAAVEAAKPNV